MGLDQSVIAVRYLKENHVDLYKKFSLKNKISKSTFYKYLKTENQHKYPYRLTDLCDYCEWGKKNKLHIF